MRSVRSLLLARELCIGLRCAPGTDIYPHRAGSRAEMCRSFHTPPPPGPPLRPSPARSVTPYEAAFSREQRNKASFVQVLQRFCGRDVRRRGHVELIAAALRLMPEFGVEKDLEVYNKLLDVFPKEVFAARNFIQSMFNHYPRQQECAVAVLEQMESYGITPNSQTRFLLLQIFGANSHPTRKYQRLMYWFPRFKHTNPFPVPAEIPSDPVDLARLCLQRIAPDGNSQVTVYQMPSTEECEDGTMREHTHLVGIQSPDQISLLSSHDPSLPVLVEGPFPLWLKKTCVYYYVLRADPVPSENQEEVVDHERCLYYPLGLDLELERDLGDDDSFDVDDVEEGPIFAMCMTGSGDERTLGMWIRGLQVASPVLTRTPVLFRLSSGPRELGPAAEREREPQGEEEEPEKRRMEQ